MPPRDPYLRVASPPPKPLLTYDGDCGFCKRWVTRWRDVTADVVDYEPYQEASKRFPEIPEEAFEQSVQLIEPDGRVTSAAHAALRAFALSGRRRALLWSYEHLPGVASVAEALYRFVSRHRGGFLMAIDRFLWGRTVVPIRYALTRAIFLRLLGVIYAIAFVSLWVQIDGLVGSDGIAPAATCLQSARDYVGGPSVYARLPTLAWIYCSDTALHLLCGGGFVLSILLILGVAQVPVLVLLWMFYLSLVNVGQEFLAFQWDALLLEAGFLAIFFAPWQLWQRWTYAYEPSRIVLFLFRWLLFRVLFFSGVVKLFSGDKTWAEWTALKYHYETQPLPAWTSWYAHHWSVDFQKWSVGVVFFAELFVPLLMLLPRRMRLIAFWLSVVFQLLIALTGNFGFFNLLTIVLCAILLDDAAWPGGKRLIEKRGPVRSPWRLPGWVLAIVLAIILSISVPQLIEAFTGPRRWPAPLAQVRAWVEPFDISNSYGLFRAMTTSRPEIIIEGSDDLENWRPYEFKWKPGDVTHRPAFTTPHMPRLDWQMWFAALGDYRRNAWFIHFLDRLLQGSPAVVQLLDHNPFPDAPPKYIRAVLYDYRFSNGETRAKTGAWWVREREGIYCPMVSKETSDAEKLE